MSRYVYPKLTSHLFLKYIYNQFLSHPLWVSSFLDLHYLDLYELETHKKRHPYLIAHCLHPINNVNFKILIISTGQILKILDFLQPHIDIDGFNENFKLAYGKLPNEYEL